jgi:predicted TPR repeat methyltransferase
MKNPPRYQDYVIKDGKFIGDFEGMYKNFDDPWHQSRQDHIFDSRRQLALLACARLKATHEVSKVIELGCGFGFLTDKLREQGFSSLGTDISPTSIEKAKEKNPESQFQVADYNDFNLMNSFNPDIIIMAELTWYVLDSLEDYISRLKSYALLREKPTFFIHLLATYEKGVQKYGSDKFTNLDEILAYFNMQYLETGFIKTQREDDEKSQGTYFIAKLS